MGSGGIACMSRLGGGVVCAFWSFLFFFFLSFFSFLFLFLFLGGGGFLFLSGSEGDDG